MAKKQSATGRNRQHWQIIIGAVLGLVVAGFMIWRATGAVDPLTGLSGQDRASERAILKVAHEQALGTVKITSRQNENDDEYGVVGRNYDGTYEEMLPVAYGGRYQTLFSSDRDSDDSNAAYLKQLRTFDWPETFTVGMPWARMHKFTQAYKQATASLKKLGLTGGFGFQRPKADYDDIYSIQLGDLDRLTVLAKANRARGKKAWGGYLYLTPSQYFGPAKTEKRPKNLGDTAWVPAASAMVITLATTTSIKQGERGHTVENLLAKAQTVLKTGNRVAMPNGRYMIYSWYEEAEEYGLYWFTVKNGRVQQFALSHEHFDHEQAYHGD